MTEFEIVVAINLNRGIGKAGKTPWRNSADMKFFKDLTTGEGNNVVIMGRNTYESIPEKFRPLSDRVNIVLTREPEKFKMDSPLILASSLDVALQLAREKVVVGFEDKPRRIFVIGGGQVYKEAMQHKDCTTLHITNVSNEKECDVFFPDVPQNFDLVHSEALKNEKKTEDDASYYIWKRT